MGILCGRSERTLKKTKKQYKVPKKRLRCFFFIMVSSQSFQNSDDNHRPWGYYCVLADETDHKVKRIVVYPKQRLSLQRHKYRNEHWYIVKGEAVVTRNDEEITLKAGEAVDIPVKAWHRIMNPGDENLLIIETQTGDYFGEDDIERSQDDYGRA